MQVGWYEDNLGADRRRQDKAGPAARLLPSTWNKYWKPGAYSIQHKTGKKMT